MLFLNVTSVSVQSHSVDPQWIPDQVILRYLAELCDDAEGVALQEAVVEGDDGRVVQLGQQTGFLCGSDGLVRSKVADRNLLQHLPERHGSGETSRGSPADRCITTNIRSV